MHLMRAVLPVPLIEFPAKGNDIRNFIPPMTGIPGIIMDTIRIGFVLDTSMVTIK